MRRLSIAEHQRIPIGLSEGITKEEADRLRRFDEAESQQAGRTVFDWSRTTAVRARGYVGVVQVPGLLVEILPKVDATTSDRRAQRNLLYMLELAGAIRARDRSLASLDQEPVSLLDAFVIVFADSLLDALREGMGRSYVTVEDNLPVVRGRLLVQEQVRRNSVHRERVYVRFDEFSPDTSLNRVLKAACREVVCRVASFGAVRRVRELLARFDEVSDVSVAQLDDGLTLTRQNARFQPHLDFARLVLGGASPSFAAGETRSFSLLFPMHRVFELFVAEFVRRHSVRLGLGDTRVVAQASGAHLLQDAAGQRFFGLQPDLLGRGPGGEARFVLDTKWKVIRAGQSLHDVSRADAYQLYAYAQRLGSDLNVLLYPAVPGSTTMTFRFEATSRELKVAFVDVSRDLRQEEGRLVEELRQILDSATGRGGVAA